MGLARPMLALALLGAAVPVRAAGDVPSSIESPRLINYVEPVYPEAARAADRDGVVELRIEIDFHGEVVRVEVIATPMQELGEAAAVAATGFRFASARRDGVAVGAVIDFRMEFRLHDAEAGELGADDSQLEPELQHPSGGTAAGEVPPSYETVVTGTRLRSELRRPRLELDVTPTVSRYTLNRRDIEMTPGSLEDVARAVQALPGVVGEPGLLATFFVRGGDADEVSFYLDGVPLANGFHLGGFATVFNPELIDSVQLFAGGQPARYRSSLSGILDVEYIAGDPSQLETMADVSMQTAKANVSGPTGVEGLSFLFSARRSYFEAYFTVLAELGVVGRGLAAPDFGEYLGKLTYRRGNDTVHLTVLHATDGLSFSSRAGEQALISFEGALRIANSLDLVSLRWLRNIESEAIATEVVLAYTRDANVTARNAAAQSGVGTGSLLSSGDALLDSLIARVGLRLGSGDHRLRAGLDFTWRQQRFIGRVEDSRTLPTWASTPLADLGLPTLDVAPRLETSEVDLYVEDEWRDLLPGLTAQAGIRVGLDNRGEALFSPRFALSYSPFAGSVIKAAAGLYGQRPTDPLSLDARYGNANLGAERALHLIAGFEQLLPLEILVRGELYYKDLSRLIVTPDNAAAIARGITFANSGSGFAQGVDLSLVRRGALWGAGISYGYLKTMRTNPLNEVFDRRYEPMQAQEHTLGIAADLRLWEDWVFVARYQFHTPRPFTPITSWRRELRDGARRCVPELGEVAVGGRRRVNGARHGPFHELSLRVERWFRFTSWRLLIYAEVINVTNTTTTFVDSWATCDPTGDTDPKLGTFDTLPIRPFVGLRAEM